MIELNKISDHKSIETLFYFNVKMRETIKHKAWKRTNTEKIKKISNLLWILKYLDFSTEIEQYAIYLLQFTKNLMKIDWSKNQNETFCFMKIQFHFIRTALIFCSVSSHEKKSSLILSYKMRIWFCFISQNKNLILFHLTK